MAGAGPQLVVTDLALFDFANADREMQLTCVYPGVSREEVRAAVGWELREADRVAEAEAPTADEVRLLREELDPAGLSS